VLLVMVNGVVPANDAAAAVGEGDGTIGGSVTDEVTREEEAILVSRALDVDVDPVVVGRGDIPVDVVDDNERPCACACPDPIPIPILPASDAVIAIVNAADGGTTAGKVVDPFFICFFDEPFFFDEVIFPFFDPLLSFFPLIDDMPPPLPPLPVVVVVVGVSVAVMVIGRGVVRRLSTLCDT
jgi:hypothetical protein